MIVDSLFAEGESIPVVGITGTHGKTAVARLLAHLIHLSGRRVGLACSDGLHIDRRHVQKSTAPTGHRATACCSTPPSRRR